MNVEDHAMCPPTSDDIFSTEPTINEGQDQTYQMKPT